MFVSVRKQRFPRVRVRLSMEQRMLMRVLCTAWQRYRDKIVRRANVVGMLSPDEKTEEWDDRNF
jgi:cation transport regulator ChaB